MSIVEVVPAVAIDLGTIGYREAYQRQCHVVEKRQHDDCPDTLFLLEHPHVITVGRRKNAHNNVLTPGEIDVVPTERGGDATYHGPGQLVGYVLFALRENERDLHLFLRNLEEAIIRSLVRFGICANRDPDKTGVWVGGKKIASLGVACRRWVTFHGFALNVTTDLSYFHRMNPCGLEPSVMTNMVLSRPGQRVEMQQVKREIVSQMGAVFCRDFRWSEEIFTAST